MSDHILHNGELFDGSTVLELGAGVGVVSIVACLSGAKCVLCTSLYIKDTCTIPLDMQTQTQTYVVASVC